MLNFPRLSIFHFIVENYGNRYIMEVKVAEIEENGGFQTPSLENLDYSRSKELCDGF